MKILGFILGRETDLCKAEIFSILEKNNEKYQIILNTRDVLIVDGVSQKIDIDKLGGTIKLFEVLGTELPKEKLNNFIQSKVEINQTEKRINFGISGYGHIQANNIYAIGKKIKEKLVENGLKARLVTGKFKDLSSVIVTENKLLERGFEMIIVENKGKYFVGQTVAVQNYKAYSKRDFGRTARDDRSGMLPPKLAQILVNIGGKSTDKTVYDPFCGSGTVLQEAALMGFQNIYGSDLSEKAVADTKKNLEWLSSLLPEQNNESLVTNIFQSDVLSPSLPAKADLIVGEGYLGEPTRRNVAKATSDAKNLADFYLKALTQLSRILNENGRIVLALPYFIIGKEKVYLPLIERLNLTGLKQITIPNSTMTLRHSFNYARPDSFVGREIFVLEKI